MQFTLAKNHLILSTHYNATSINVSWPHFSWPTLYILLILQGVPPLGSVKQGWGG